MISMSGMLLLLGRQKLQISSLNRFDTLRKILRNDIEELAGD